MTVIDTFLTNWKNSAREYYINLEKEYTIQMKKDHPINEETLSRIVNCNFKRKFDDEKIAKTLEDIKNNEYLEEKIQIQVNYSEFKYWKNNQTKKDLTMVKETYNKTRFEEILNKEADKKKKDLIKKVENKAGKILDAEGLRIAKDGMINGTIIGENKTVTVETILAGGYNIQMLHYRVLVK